MQPGPAHWTPAGQTLTVSHIQYVVFTMTSSTVTYALFFVMHVVLHLVIRQDNSCNAFLFVCDPSDSVNVHLCFATPLLPIQRLIPAH